MGRWQGREDSVRWVVRSMLLLLIAVPVLAFAVVWLAFQDAPAVVRTVEFTPRDIENAKRIVARHAARPSDAPAMHTMVLGEADLDLLLNYAASRFGQGAARVSLQPSVLRLEATAEVPQSPFGRYLNVDATLRETGALPRVERLRIGAVPVPAPLADYALREALRRFYETDRGGLANDIVKRVTIADRRIRVTYVWNTQIEERLRGELLSPEERARLRAYHDRLVEMVAKVPSRVSLADLMPPMFALALERSAGGDASAESRAAIVVLALYVSGAGLEAILPEARRWPKPAQRSVTLAGRTDLPKHFLVSAAIAAEAGSPLADAIGLYKEIDDSRGGSGFSFTDIAADRAGTRFGEITAQSGERARKLAQAAASGLREDNFMPAVSDLPEFLSAAEFERRYGGVDGPEYRRMMAEIKARIASRPLLSE